MTDLQVDGTLLTFTLAAPADPATAPTPTQEVSAGPIRMTSRVALSDPRAVLFSPCAPNMAFGKVTKTAEFDGVKMKTSIDKQSPGHPKSHPTVLFNDLTFKNAGESGTNCQQVTTHRQLNTEQVQVLVGKELSVFGRA